MDHVCKIYLVFSVVPYHSRDCGKEVFLLSGSLYCGENPDMTAREAVTLSRKMMDGHKWECFVFELSFIGWEILGILTIGIFNIFYTNPYKTAAFTRYYAELRAEALEKGIPGSELLYDTYLYEKAGTFLLRAKYPDVGGVHGESGW